MEFSVREAKAQFSAAIAAAESGEHVVVTRHGKPVATIVAYEPKPVEDFWKRLAGIRDELGIKPIEGDWVDAFNDPAFSRTVLGLED